MEFEWNPEKAEINLRKHNIISARTANRQEKRFYEHGS